MNHWSLITWEKPSHDFGEIFQGDKVEHTFKFSNTGNQRLGNNQCGSNLRMHNTQGLAA
ncbi:MAG: DUF1573 domain-containing protein [Cytophagales bacterium]|nr:DUF1573 domain-containing protein [Cytophagales bacterium]